MFSELLSILFPNCCPACGEAMVHGESMICTHCLSALPFTDFHKYANNPVEKLFWGKTNLKAGTALFYFNKGNRVQRLMHQLKYHGGYEVGVILGHMLGNRIKHSERFAQIDRVIPVPLHPKKLKLRGFNQSEAIAKGIAESAGIPLDITTLARNINTATQTKKSRFDRYKNVKGVFELKAFDSPCQHVLLVDDVVTTGSTLASCIDTVQSAKIDVSICVAACAE